MSVSRAFSVVEFLAQNGPATLRGLARHLDLPIGSAHRLLATLSDEHLVTRTADDEWDLSYRILQIAGSYLDRLDLPTVARSTLEELASRTDQTAFLAMPSGSEIVYLDKIQTKAQVQLYVPLGARRPINCTALGKSILAFLPEEQRERILSVTPLTAVTEFSVTDAEILRTELAEVRDQGYAVDRQEAVEGVYCLAAPILDHSARPIAAISIAGPDARIGDNATELAHHVLRASGEISRSLGHRDR